MRLKLGWLSARIAPKVRRVPALFHGSFGRSSLASLGVFAAVASGGLFWPEWGAAWPLLGVLAALTLNPWIRWITDRREDPLSPLHVFSGIYFLYFVARGLQIVSRPSEIGRFGESSEAIFVQALALATLAYAFFLLGYHSRWGSGLVAALPRVASVRATRRTFWVIGGLLLIGWNIRIWMISRGWHLKYAAPSYVAEQAAWVSAVAYFGVFASFGFIALTFLHFGGKLAAPATVGWFALLVSEAGYAFIGGSKFALAFLPLVIVAAWHFNRKPIRPWALTAGATAFIFLFPIVNVYRANTTFSDVTENGFLSTIGETIAMVASMLVTDPLGWIRITFEQFVGRAAGVDILMSVLSAVPEIVDYQMGGTFVSVAVITLVPRFLLPDKYELFPSANSIMTNTVWNMGEKANSGIAATQVGEFYLNFGLPGVILGMMLLGVLYRWVYTYLVLQGVSLVSFVCYVFFLYWAIPIELDFTISYNNLVKSVGLFLPAAWLLNGGRFFAPRDVATDEAVRDIA